MDPLTIGLGVAKAGMGIMGAIGGRNNAIAEARAKNEAMMKEYKYRLQIRDKRWKDELQLYPNKLGQYDLKMKAADRAAARAYGVESYKQGQRVKKAAFTTQQLNRALIKNQGAAVAAGKSGRSAERADREVENAFIRNQNMIDVNLMGAAEQAQMDSFNIRDRLEGVRNQAYSQVAIAPTTPMELLEPTQYSGPSSSGMMLGIGNSILGGIGSIAGNMAPNVGNLPGGGGGGDFYSSLPAGAGFGSGAGSLDLGITPLTSGMNFFQ